VPISRSRIVAFAISFPILIATAVGQHNPTVASGSKITGLQPISCASEPASLNKAAAELPNVATHGFSESNMLMAQTSVPQLAPHGVTPDCTTPPAPTNPEFLVTYNSFIPQDHIPGSVPTTCSVTTPYNYLGDRQGDPVSGGSPYSYRTEQEIYLLPNSSTTQYPYSDTGYTNQFFSPSPVNGQYITSVDYDGIAGDCYKWTGQAKSAYGANGNYANITNTVGASSVTTNFAGQDTNPLQIPSFGAIRWNVSITVNKTTGWSSHAYVTGAVSCYPSHKVTVNNNIVAYFNAPINPGFLYIENCLVSNGPSTPLQGLATSSGGASVPDL
jgi:hypothetical protein